MALIISPACRPNQCSYGSAIELFHLIPPIGSKWNKPNSGKVLSHSLSLSSHVHFALRDSLCFSRLVRTFVRQVKCERVCLCAAHLPTERTLAARMSVSDTRLD